MRNTLQIGQCRFNLSKFDAKAPDLYLIVDAAAKTDIAITIENNRIARSVEDWIGAVALKRIIDELVAGKFLALQITLSDARTTDQQFAFGAGLKEPD